MGAESHFLRQLEQLKLTVLRMAAKTENAVERAFEAFSQRDMTIAEGVIKGDEELNQLEIKIDEQALKLLALEQPVARDLRSIIGYLRIATELERIGDQAVNIAQRAVFLAGKPPLPAFPAMDQLMESVMDMFRSVTNALMNENVSEAHDVCQMDDEADEQNIRVLKSSIERMTNQAPAIERTVHTIITARCMERIGDLCTNIAESIIFIVKGVNIKHRCQD